MYLSHKILLLVYNTWQTRGAAQDLAANLAQQQKSLFRAVAATDESIIIPILTDVESYGQKIQADLNVLYTKVFPANKGIVDSLASKIAEWD